MRSCMSWSAMTAEVGRYTEQVFRMFTGEPKTVTLESYPSLIGVVFDKDDCTDRYEYLARVEEEAESLGEKW